MTAYYRDDGTTPERPERERPTWRIGPNRLAEILLDRTDASFVRERLKERIRRLTWLDELGQDQVQEMWRACRMLYELSATGDGILRLTSLSKEDADVLYGFPEHWGTAGLRRVLDEVRPRIRESGPVGPVEADRMAKEVVDLMAC